MQIYNLDCTISIELKIFNADWHPCLPYDELWAMTTKHSEKFQCEAKWKPLVQFCLMWATTTANPDRCNLLDLEIRRETLNSWINENVTVKIISDSEPGEYEYSYDSWTLGGMGSPHIRFSLKIRKNESLQIPRTLMEAFRNTVPYEISDISCKICLKPYKLKWYKIEDPYILQLAE